MLELRIEWIQSAQIGPSLVTKLNPLLHLGLRRKWHEIQRAKECMGGGRNTEPGDPSS